jgi:Fe-S-cluster containining protein
LTPRAASSQGTPVNVREPIPALRRDLEQQPRRDGTVDVRDPFLLQVFTLDAGDLDLARRFDGARDARALARALATEGLEVTARRLATLARELDELSLLDTPAVWKKKPSADGLAPHSQLVATDRRPSALPVFQEEARWSCHACGACCHGLVVELEPFEEARIDASLYRDILGEEGFVEEAFIDPEQPARRVLRQRKDAEGACIFLRPDGLCSVHARQGMHAKPDACQIFPYMVLSIPGRAPRIGMRVNCASMHRSFEDGATVGEAIPEVLRILETSPSHRVGRTLEWFGASTPVARVEAAFARIGALVAEGALDATSLDAIDRELLGRRVARARRRFGRELLAYLEREEAAEIPVEEGSYFAQVARVRRGVEALEAMQRGEAPPKVSAKVQAFLRRQLGHALHLFGPANLPDAGLGTVALMLALEATLHAVGPRGRLESANVAFMVFTAPLLETTTHAWPVLDAIDRAHARRLRKALAAEA